MEGVNNGVTIGSDPQVYQLLKPVCYTALFSNYEELKTPRVITPGWRYICYTDQPVTSDVWEVIHTPVPEFTTPQRYARYMKIMGFIDWPVSIWVDASFCIDTDLTEWWNRNHLKPFSAAHHPLRNDFYEECMDCITGQRGDRIEVEKQMNEYLAAGVPRRNGLIQSGILLRTSEQAVIDLCEDWWREMQGRSVRDQIAFARVSVGCEVLHCYQWDYRRGKDFIYHHHYCRR